MGIGGSFQKGDKKLGASFVGGTVHIVVFIITSIVILVVGIIVVIGGIVVIVVHVVFVVFIIITIISIFESTQNGRTKGLRRDPSSFAPLFLLSLIGAGAKDVSKSLL